MMLRFNFDNSLSFLGSNSVLKYIEHNKKLLEDIFSPKEKDEAGVLGWFNVEKWTNTRLVAEMKCKASEIRDNGDIFVLVGVGGSNNGARSLIKAFNAQSNIEVVYAGNNLSSKMICELLDKLKGKLVYINVIAKNFETLEPGLTFRILRDFMWEQYGDDISSRVIITGTPGSQLYQLAEKNGYMFLPFPYDIGGRFSVLSPVGLFPAAVAGIEIGDIIQGAKDMEHMLKSTPFRDNPAIIYAAIRHLMEKKGFAMEFLSSFEPYLEFFSKWWVQLFAESEGKNFGGLFPVSCNFTEDLHSVGQYIQNGKRNFMETFLYADNTIKNYIVQPDNKVIDGFDYLNNMDIKSINDIAFSATVKAHISGGVPCNIITIPQLTPYYFGQLFYYFQLTCYVSGMFNGINPFDQPGVEEYKNEMFRKLKRYD